jgi:hypothetical protein
MTETNGSESLSGFKVLAFFTADHAVVENGKVYVNGGFFDRVYHPVFPALLSISVVCWLEISPQRFQRDHRFTLQMKGEGEPQPLVKIEGGLRVAPSPDAEPGEPARVPLAVPLTGFSLPRAGDYWFVLSIDDQEVDRTGIRARQVGVIGQVLPQMPTGGSGESQEE